MGQVQNGHQQLHEKQNRGMRKLTNNIPLHFFSSTKLYQVQENLSWKFLFCSSSLFRPFYTSEVIRFRSGFNPNWTEFVASTLKPVPVESISNRFESIHFAMWFRSGSNWIGNYWGWIHVTQLRVTCVGNSWSGVEERRKLYVAYSLGRRPDTTRYQRIQAE